MFESLIASAAPLKVEIKFVYVKEHSEYSVVFIFFVQEHLVLNLFSYDTPVY